MVAPYIWDVEAQFESDIFCQVKALPAIHKRKLCIIGSTPILATKQLNRQAGKAIIYESLVYWELSQRQ